MTKQKNKVRLQKEDFAIKFQEMKADISAEDKKILVDKNITSVATLNRYLSGDIADTGVAFKILTFFQKRIAQRQKALIA